MVETHQQIKDRLIKNAAAIWGLKGTQTESNFDPLVGILLGACATELEKISHDIEETRGRTLERMVQLLYPEVLSHAIPAHAIMHAYPAERKTTLQGDAQFYYQKRFTTGGEGALPVWKNIYFSSTGNFDLHQAAVKIVGSTKNIYVVKDGVNKELACSNPFSRTSITSQNSLWLGIENIENLSANSSFYFELKNEAGKNLFYDYLPSAKWYFDNELVKTQRYFGKNISVNDKPNPEEIISGKTNAINRILKHVNKFYANRFITATTLANRKHEKNWPEELKKLFSEIEITRLKEENLGWLRIDFPENLDIGQLQDDLLISLNCFPVVNRHLIISQQKLMDHLNIIPLSSEELFLDIAEVTDIDGNAVTGSSRDENRMKINLHFGGVERFNEKNAVSAVEGLIQQLRDESAAYSNIGNDFLNIELKSLQQSLNKLEQQIVEKQLLKGDTPYLIVSDKDQASTGNIYVKYWTTNGEDANNIRSGTTLSLYKNADVQSNTVKLVTTVTGGRNNLSNRDKVLAYKTALLSKEKLVTEEDIASYCRLRLALGDAHVEVTKGYKVQENSRGGFLKTIDVNIFLTEYEWRQLLTRGDISFWEEDLEAAISENSNLLMPLRVFIKLSEQ